METLISHGRMQSSAENSTWRQISRTYAADYIVLFCLLLVLCITEISTPFQKYIYHSQEFEKGYSDAELWRYSYPLEATQRVPAWAVPVVSFLVPAAVLTAYKLVFKPSRLEFHNLLLGLFGSVLSTALFTNFVKLTVGRPRPNFLNRCWPNGVTPVFDIEGRAVCSADAVNAITEGRKSFPSGHASWTSSGLGYLTWFLAGKLRCFDGSAHPWRLVAAFLPMAGAIWIGITRLQDYMHHVEDVIAGLLIGATFSYAFYRQQYPSIVSSRNAGQAYAEQQPPLTLTDWSKGNLPVRGAGSNPYVGADDDRPFSGRVESIV